MTKISRGGRAHGRGYPPLDCNKVAVTPAHKYNADGALTKISFHVVLLQYYLSDGEARTQFYGPGGVLAQDPDMGPLTPSIVDTSVRTAFRHERVVHATKADDPSRWFTPLYGTRGAKRARHQTKRGGAPKAVGRAAQRGRRAGGPPARARGRASRPSNIGSRVRERVAFGGAPGVQLWVGPLAGGRVVAALLNTLNRSVSAEPPRKEAGAADLETIFPPDAAPILPPHGVRVFVGRAEGPAPMALRLPILRDCPDAPARAAAAVAAWAVALAVTLSVLNFCTRSGELADQARAAAAAR